MKANIFTQPFVLYAGNLCPKLYNDKEKLKEFKLLQEKTWRTDIYAVSRITHAVNISPNRANPVIEYEALP